MNLEVLNRYYEEGWLIKQTHPELPLTIWNYSQSTQYERKWDDVTLQCRGLVTDDEGNVVARPFKKFFNIEEGQHTPTKDFSVYEKMDGSLGIGFWYKGEWVFASRGSFTSEQCLRGKVMFDEHFNKLWHSMYRGWTYLFEIIYPENRVVVDYGGKEELVLLGVINTQSGEEISYTELRKMPEFSWMLVKQYDNIDDYTTLKQMVKDNQEGFVIHFSNGDRCKIKGDEYVRLHGIMTNASTTSVWEVLKNQDSMEQYLKEVPDEFYQKIRVFKESLEEQYWEVANKAEFIFKSVYRDNMNASEFASEVRYLDKVYQGLLWNQFHMKFTNYSETIWNYIKPEFQKL